MIIILWIPGAALAGGLNSTAHKRPTDNVNTAPLHKAIVVVVGRRPVCFDGESDGRAETYE